MTINDLKKKIFDAGLESCHLDDIVHEAASQLGSDANNGGLDGQIEFLTDKCGWSLDDVWATLLV